MHLYNLAISTEIKEKKNHAETIRDLGSSRTSSSAVDDKTRVLDADAHRGLPSLAIPLSAPG
jgi:hypothetical protein